MKKILVLRGGALGDFIVTLPALTLLRERWPGAKIELIGNATAARLARNRGWLDAVHSQHEARWSGLFADGPIARDLADWLGEFDLVLNYWPDADRTLQRRFPLRAGQIYITAEAMPRQSPAAAHYCEPLRALGLVAPIHFTRIQPLPISERESSRSTPSSAIVIHPGSGSPKKNWPEKNWLELVPRLPVPVILIAGEAEAPRWATYSRPGVTVLGPTPLEELVHHFAACRLFVGHDSGLSHLAAACGAPCVLLFGPTDPAMWAPPAPAVTVLRRGGDLASIAIDQVGAAMASALAARK